MPVFSFYILMDHLYIAHKLLLKRLMDERKEREVLFLLHMILAQRPKSDGIISLTAAE